MYTYKYTTVNIGASCYTTSKYTYTCTIVHTFKYIG